MAYTPHVWVPRLGSNLNRFTKANETSTSVDLTNAPEIVTQAGTPFSTDIMNEMESGIASGANNASYFATDTTTSGSTQSKTASGSEKLDYDRNPVIEVMMSYAQKYDNRTLVDGSTVTYQNTILAAKALTLSYNGGTAYPIKGGRGEYLGIGSWGAGELLRFRFIGSSSAGGYWYCENVKAIMQGGDNANGYYTKYPNGKTEESISISVWDGSIHGLLYIGEYHLSISDVSYANIKASICGNGTLKETIDANIYIDGTNRYGVHCSTNGFLINISITSIGK